MEIEIIGLFDKNQRYCAGSLTKLLTTYAALSLLSEQYKLDVILDDITFLDSLCTSTQSREFLTLFQNIIGSQFTLRDVCSYYTGLPYTFDLSHDELVQVEAGMQFKHHSILSEETFLSRCKNNITPVYANQCKFHYSEIGILFLGYFIEKCYHIQFEELFERYITKKFNLKNSIFSRTIVENTYIQDLSNSYDYPSIAIADHGYFCYSNGFYSTLNDMKLLLENMIPTPVFQTMVAYENARAASNTIMNGLTIELRAVKDDIIYGYEGLSFSGCNLWAFSTKLNKGYITFNNDEEEIYNIIYNNTLGYSHFDNAPSHTQTIYKTFISQYHEDVENKPIPSPYQGNYQRVMINTSTLPDIFIVESKHITIRNPDEVRYDIIYVNGQYWIKGKDQIHGSRVGFYLSTKGNHYLFFDGTLYQQIIPLSSGNK